MAVAKAPSSNDLNSTLARDWALQVQDPEDNSTWVFVRGLAKFAPKTELTMKDDSDIDSEGYKSNIATALQLTFEGEGFRKGQLAGDKFTQDEGQAILREVGRNMGLRNVIKARAWRTDGVDEGYESNFSVEWTDTDGGNEDLDQFSFTMMSRGKPTRIKPVETPTGASVPVSEAGGSTIPEGTGA
ncbi:phage tail tube protein [Corynebacterium liangguodongii]|uniref:Uncharacterized protein n=1 Tax=Corynebacterium liangguodongii TaxID=2079535 RepID=A0A2S0WG73_9CORY|nr:hypothetical protein [Corynebacterium liangguodongii]AWB84775.1 hypothetical protein C3E79_10075 [Corynebacterium liangguodongii]PWB99133.1 hypothetical protein DF219_07690 [Corynebacterium liangguodongii]